MKKITSSMLQHQWKHLYDNTKYHRKLSKFENNKRHQIFNNLLLNYLFECHENKWLPSKDKMEKVATKFLEETEKKLYMGEYDKNRLCVKKIDESFMQMTFAPILTDHDEEGDLEATFLIIYGIISVRSLTKPEVEFVESCFGHNYEFDKEFDAIKIRLMQLPVSIDNITESKQDEINAYCLRVCRSVFKEYAKKEKNMDTDFKYTLMEKCKDYFFNGTI